MSHVHPFIPIATGESLVSWISRFARIQCGNSVPTFLDMFGIQQQQVKMAKPEAINKLARLSGVQFDELMSATFQPLGKRRYRHFEQEFSLEFLSRSPIKFCPKCICEDLQNGDDRLPLPKGRLNWVLSPVRTCAKHQASLIEIPSAGTSASFVDLAEHLPPRAQVLELAEAAVQLKPSGLQTYVERRFLGGRTHTWLDNQDIDQATKATEMLGACIEFGAHFEQSKLSEAEWDMAGRIGFEFTSRGEEGVRKGLSYIQSKPEKSVCHSGPQGVFGQLYKWLQFSRAGKPVGPIRDVLREHVLDTMAVKPGQMLLGQKVEESRRQTIATLSAQFDIHADTVALALRKFGLISSKVTSDNLIATVPAKEAVDVMRRLSRAVPIARIPGYVGCSRTHAQAMIKTKLLFSVVADSERDSGRHKGVDSRDLDRLIDKIYAQGREVERASFGMANIAETSCALHVPFVSIVRALLGGKLQQVETLKGTTSFYSVFVSLEEVSKVLRLQTGKAGVTISDAARELKLTSQAVSYILSTKDKENQPYLKTCGQLRHMGTMRDLIDPSSLDEFKTTYKKLSDFCDRRPNKMSRKREELAARGVFPEWKERAVRAEFYRLSDL
ncbi:TniQ protein [Shimia gijangensis]|uniref:TniQ protein n=1 Tax=Shimia gijangensis TaxID=1470563 RepID=A0A1M6SSG2_9RHOB|nr:TniQ family protein [Shimia gijangensis]SHK47672.1 TniQ protein [Shimia gijangensis]